MEMEWIRPIAVVAVPTIALVISMAVWVGKHKEWMKGIDEFKQDTKRTLAEIREDIKKLLAAQPPSVLASTSPVRLTDLGEEVSERVGAAACAEQIAARLIDEVRGKSAYEVQEFCINHMRDDYERTSEQDRVFKECAYEHDIKLKQVLDVCAVELRDKLLHRLGSEDTA